MNNIELQHLKRDAKKFFGEDLSNRIDRMNGGQLDKLKKKIDGMKQKVYPSHKEIRTRKIKERKEKIKLGFGPKFSVIIPYMHTGERYPLLLSCISSLKCDVEICIVEIGEQRNLFLSPDDFEYMFVGYKGVMHRGWALNLGARHLSTGQNIILLDADVIVPDNFFSIIKNVDYPAVGWNKMYYLDHKNTSEYLERKMVNGENNIFNLFTDEKRCEVIKTPRIDGPAGGITIIPRDIFFRYKGVSENFEGTWGGPDNALMAKYRAFGNGFRTIDCNSIHLYHSKNTPRKKEIALKARDMMKWTQANWSNELNRIVDNWGRKSKGMKRIGTNYNTPEYMNINTLKNIAIKNTKQEDFPAEIVIDDLCEMWSGFNRGTLKRVFENKETILSVAMLSLLRTDIMLKMLDNWNRTMHIPNNIAFNVQGQQWLSKNNRDLIKEKVDKYFDKNHLIFTNGNKGTGSPRHNMIHRALDFDTPYIMTTDDDMFFPPGAIEALISILEDRPELGAIDMWVHPNLNAWFMKPSKMQYKQPKVPFGFVDGMGSATMIMRREVFQTCDYDHLYYVGWADIDFCMQMRKSKWELAILALPDYKAFNYKGRGTQDYKQYSQYRHDSQHAGNSSVRFQRKWQRQI